MGRKSGKSGIWLQQRQTRTPPAVIAMGEENTPGARLADNDRGDAERVSLFFSTHQIRGKRSASPALPLKPQKLMLRAGKGAA